MTVVLGRRIIYRSLGVCRLAAAAQSQKHFYNDLVCPLKCKVGLATSAAAAEYANQTPFAVTTSSEGGKLTVTLSHCALRFLYYNSRRT